MSLSDVKTVALESEEVKEIIESFEDKLAERDEQTKPLLWLAELAKSDPELAELVKKSAFR